MNIFNYDRNGKRSLDGFACFMWFVIIFFAYVFIALIFCLGEEQKTKERLYKECMQTNPEWECYAALRDYSRRRR